MLPLAGHELGHTIWNLKDFETKFDSNLEQHVLSAIAADKSSYQKYFPNHQIKSSDTAIELNVNIFVKRTIAPVLKLALARAQEYFCDSVGVYLFDQAFLHSYAYLVSPSIACPRHLHYPNNIARIRNTINAAAYFRKSAPDLYQVPPDFMSMFEDSPEPGDAEQQYLSSLADIAAEQLCNTLIPEAENLLKAASAPQLNTKIRDAILDEFRLGVPGCNATSVTNILNAGWIVYNDAKFWSHITDDIKRKKVLGNLVIKNIELLEIEHLAP